MFETPNKKISQIAIAIAHNITSLKERFMVLLDVEGAGMETSCPGP